MEQKERIWEYTRKPVAVYVWHELGLGDNIFITPLIRKLYNIYDEKVTLFTPTHHFNLVTEFFKNNPYIEKHLRVGDTDETYPIDRYENFIVYHNNWNDYYYSDLRQLAANGAGITLKEEEMDLDYFPDSFINIDVLPKKFVCINPYISGIDRNWEREKWQDLVDRLNNDGIYVVCIGKGVENVHYYNLDIKLGVNLCNKECQNNLSQTWHIINKSEFFVSFDCGIFTLAGTTDTYIIQIGWYGDPYYHMPMRKGIRWYKYDYIRGECDVYCLTDPKFDLNEWGTITQKHIVQKCMLDRNWICKPSSEKVYFKIKELYK